MEGISSDGLGLACGSKMTQRQSPPMQDNGRPPGATHLFFGCRHRGNDFLFKPEIDGFVQDGTLSMLHLALSKEGEDGRWYGGCYVQGRPGAVRSVS